MSDQDSQKHFESSFNFRPQDIDLKQSSTNLINVPKAFPEYPLIPVNNIEKFDYETLFFIFYYYKDPYWRMLAAKMLKHKKWSFNKKFQLWFTRISTPIEQTDKLEKGNFAIFDHEELWALKNCNDFVFEYKHLEPEL